MNRWILLAGSMGFAAVALGAFGAHALKDRLASAGYLETWHTAVLYHLVHSAALFAAALGRSLLPSERGDAKRALGRACFFWTLGLLLFSGSLYALSLSGIRALGAVTPLGGLALLAGWVFVARVAWTLRKTE